LVNYSGFLLVNKPVGMPSFRVVSTLRNLTKIKRIGFAGTLDPFASGLLILAIGREYTRHLDHFHTYPKTYSTTFILGKETDTLDHLGTSVPCPPFKKTEAEVRSILARYMEITYEQMPPAYSAKKISGKPAYLLARKGERPLLKAQTVTLTNGKIEEIQMSEYPEITIQVTCSKGTYIRQLAKDIAQDLETGAYVQKLCRVSIGPYILDKAMDYDAMCPESIAGALFHEH